MASFKELLKEVENDKKAGFKNGAWFPHKSAEGGTRTLGYGHKLSQQEEDGNYVVLPNGKVVDFDNRGLTDQEIEQLFDADIQKHKSIAATQWNNAQKTPFSSLSPLHQSLLTEIAYNIGGLKSSNTGKFGWPSLAKGILNDDPETIKAELMRSFTDEDGNRVQLTKRVDKIRSFVDQAVADPQTVTLEGFEPTEDVQEPELAYSELIRGMTSALDALQQPGQRGSQTPSRPPMRAEPDPVEELMAYMDKDVSEKTLTRRRNEQKLEATYNQALAESGKKFSDKEEKEIQALMRYMDKGERVQVRETTNPPPEQPKETEERPRDDSKDPIYGIF